MISGATVARWIARERAATATSGRWRKLTRRERAVALVICSGCTRTEAAATLGVSVKTIDSHRAHILDKLELRNEVELVLYSIVALVIGVDEDGEYGRHEIVGQMREYGT